MVGVLLDIFVFLVLVCFLSILLWGCIYFVWRLYLLGHSEHGTAVLDEIVKGAYYYRTRIWVYSAYVYVTYQGESFREKMKFGVPQRIIGFARGYEIPVIVSCSKSGKVRVFQKGKGDKVGLALLAVILGVIAMMFGLAIGLALSAVLSY